MAGELSGQASWMLSGLAPGSVVGGYRIESRLGLGGMAVVFRAPALSEDAEFRERFIRESRAPARVDHPHVIPVHAAGEIDGKSRITWLGFAELQYVDHLCEFPGGGETFWSTSSLTGGFLTSGSEPALRDHSAATTKRQRYQSLTAPNRLQAG